MQTKNPDPSPSPGALGRRGALSHLRVLDLSRVLAGPLAGQILGDLGADVVKVERTGRGDDTREWGPPFVTDTARQPTGESAYFMSCNRNKRSLTLDFTLARDREIARSLALRADVLLENFRVDALAAYGLDYASLKAQHPRLIYCSITGFGQSGPYAQHAGYDFLIQGMSGLMSITGEPEAQGGAPMKVGVAMIDVMSGLYADIGILAALAHRERTGEGQHIDIALMDVGVAGLINQAMNYFATGRAPQRLGNAHPSIVPYEDFPTADGYLIIAVGNDAQFARLAKVCEADWAADARFSTNDARVENRGELIGLMRAVTVQRSTAQWLEQLRPVGVPCGPINDLAALFADPHVRARGTEVELAHPLAQRVRTLASPLRLSETPVSYRRAPPTLGQHTDEILKDWLGR